ncbi:DUF3500 domain-containing protein [Paludisphaera borealis]|uniref:DUF3500 domain-containing protein n=1 Tax=Paludisphaera borealis TaxID=1387353 RepID=A0A1U7CJP4_9BACT|nr:DUF3500 domain-containing protein [Paludisphaera borealis]APW59103.1 hypothetical protein BSF38_00517 [Paludisphaera borealis]
MSRVRSLLLAITIAALYCHATLAAAHDGPGTHTHEKPAAKAAREMAGAARNLWASLTPEQKTKIGFDFKDALRYDWHFIPRPRKGLPLKEMSGDQKALATALLASGLSQSGFIKAESIVSLEQILASIEQGKGPVRDPELYYFNIFGNPDSFGAKEPWGWRFEGHHLSLNFTIVGDKGVAGGPTFMGTNPAEVKAGPRQGLRVLGEEEDLARKLVKSLDSGQRAKGLVEIVAPKDILTLAARKATPLKPAGVMMTDLNAEQKELLNSIVVLYAERLRPEMAADDLGKILKAGVDKVGFAWAGGLERGEPHYYRIQGPTFLIEYDNTQNNANHVHSVWRDFEDDFGDDLLKKHYESATAEHGHSK